MVMPQNIIHSAPWDNFSQVSERKVRIMKRIAVTVSVIIAVMLSVNAFAQDRMPAIPLDKMNDLQKKYAEEIMKGPRGRLYGPFIPLIRSPSSWTDPSALASTCASRVRLVPS